VVKKAKEAFQEMFLAYLNQLCNIRSTHPNKEPVKKLLRKTLIAISKSIIPRLTNPLLLADFLMGCLDDSTDLSN
jgi:hypothetical protein